MSFDNSTILNKSFMYYCYYCYYWYSNSLLNIYQICFEFNTHFKSVLATRAWNNNQENPDKTFVGVFHKKTS